MEIIERITETLEKTDKKATDLCDRLGIRTSTMSTWKTRNSDPASEIHQTDCRLPWRVSSLPIDRRRGSCPQAHHCRRGRTSRTVPALPQNKQFEFIGELKGFLKAYTESQKYLDKEKRLSV